MDNNQNLTETRKGNRILPILIGDKPLMFEAECLLEDFNKYSPIKFPLQRSMLHQR